MQNPKDLEWLLSIHTYTDATFQVGKSIAKLLPYFTDVGLIAFGSILIRRESAIHLISHILKADI